MKPLDSQIKTNMCQKWGMRELKAWNRESELNQEEGGIHSEDLLA